MNRARGTTDELGAFRTDKRLNRPTMGCMNQPGLKRANFGQRGRMRVPWTELGFYGRAKLVLNPKIDPKYHHMVPWKRDESAVYKGPYDKIKISRQILCPTFIGFLAKISRNNSKICFLFSLISLFLIDWKVKNDSRFWSGVSWPALIGRWFGQA